MLRPGDFHDHRQQKDNTDHAQGNLGSGHLKSCKIYCDADTNFDVRRGGGNNE